MDDGKGQLFAERIRKKIESLRCLCKQQPVRITASIGLYCLNEERLKQADLNIDTLIHYADKALYAAKAAGRNRVVLFTEEGQDK
jgi:diguanylate cyclase (GGDEF)-like protein